MKLLTIGNPKTLKGNARGYWTAILHLAPGRLSGYQVCPMATEGCLAACLNTAGHGGIARGVSRLTLPMLQAGKLNTVQRARIARTRFYFENRAAFMAQLALEIAAFVRRARNAGFTPVIRLNGTSDIPWERVRVGTAPNIMSVFPDVQFYDYTKIAKRITSSLPLNRFGRPNYHLTFSLSENNDDEARMVLERGGNVAAVFRTRDLPARYLGARVVDGDESDLRFLDPRGVIVGLYAKGNAKQDRSGFVRDVAA